MSLNNNMLSHGKSWSPKLICAIFFTFVKPRNFDTADIYLIVLILLKAVKHTSIWKAIQPTRLSTQCGLPCIHWAIQLAKSVGRIVLKISNRFTKYHFFPWFPARQSTINKSGTMNSALNLYIVFLPFHRVIYFEKR